MPLSGEWRGGRSGRVSEDRDPYTDDILVTIPLANQQDLDEAYRAAAGAQPQWAALVPGERAAILRRAATIMEARREEIVTWLIRESGSTRWNSLQRLVGSRLAPPPMTPVHVLL